MTALTKEEFAAGTKYAKQDIKILKKEGYMAITGTKKGVLNFEYENKVFSVFSNGDCIFSTDCEKTLINFIVNDVFIFE